MAKQVAAVRFKCCQLKAQTQALPTFAKLAISLLGLILIVSSRCCCHQFRQSDSDGEGFGRSLLPSRQTLWKCEDAGSFGAIIESPCTNNIAHDTPIDDDEHQEATCQED